MKKESRIHLNKDKEVEKIEKALKEAYVSAEKFLKRELKRDSNSFQVRFN